MIITLFTRYLSLFTQSAETRSTKYQEQNGETTTTNPLEMCSCTKFHHYTCMNRSIVLADSQCTRTHWKCFTASSHNNKIYAVTERRHGRKAMAKAAHLFRWVNFWISNPEQNVKFPFHLRLSFRFDSFRGCLFSFQNQKWMNIAHLRRQAAAMVYRRTGGFGSLCQTFLSIESKLFNLL